ncbi:MAG: class I SAM-dependent DNA methyltransferase [Halanaerobiales bacterium]
MERRAYTSSFASIYDDVMGAVPYNLWYDYLHEIMDYYSLTANKVLDLACGTGNMSVLFARDDYQVTGIDISAEMLEFARVKTGQMDENIKFIQSDLRSFSTSSNFDLALCLFDSLNYILDREDLKSVFENVYNSLKRDGFFIFDMNTINRLMSIKPGTTIIKGEDYSCVWEDIIDKSNKLWKVRLKIYHKDTAEYYEELHQETGYRIDVVKNLLRSTGFKCIDVYSAYTFSKADENDNRIYFVAFREKRQVRKKHLLTKSVKNIKLGVKRLFYAT